MPKKTTNPRIPYDHDDRFVNQFKEMKFHALNDKSHLGDINELVVATEHMKQGCKVYRNMGSTGHIDMIIEFPNGKLMKVDVKQLSNAMLKNKAGYKKVGLGRNDLQTELDVQYVAIKDDNIYYVNHTKTAKHLKTKKEKPDGT